MIIIIRNDLLKRTIQRNSDVVILMLQNLYTDITSDKSDACNFFSTIPSRPLIVINPLSAGLCLPFSVRKIPDVFCQRNTLSINIRASFQRFRGYKVTLCNYVPERIASLSTRLRYFPQKSPRHSENRSNETAKTLRRRIKPV